MKAKFNFNNNTFYILRVRFNATWKSKP